MLACASVTTPAETLRPTTPTPAYDAGGAVAAMQRELAERLNGAAHDLRAPVPQDGMERAISGVSRALGPLLLVGGYCAVGALIASLLY